MIDTSLGGFFLDVLKELRDVLTNAKNKRDNLIATGTFLELYGSATRLQGYTRLLRSKSHVTKSNSQIEALRAFFEEVHHFGALLRKANLAAIEVFHPKLAAELARVAGADTDLLVTFSSEIAPRYKLKPGRLKKAVDLYVHNYGVHDGGAWNAERGYGLYQWWYCQSKKSLWTKFEQLSGHLQSFRAVIAEVIRTTWDFKELATLPHIK